jgi:hypothetical protein
MRVATAALSGRIFAGKPTKDGRGFKEPRYDVTSDVLKAIRDKVGVGNEIAVASDGIVEFRIAVLAPASAIEAGTAATTKIDAVHESAVPKGDAHA